MLEKRLYFLTMYNISEIQKGIQCGHCQMEYALKFWGDEDFQDWAQNHKTWIILNGGTSNLGETYLLGSMEEHVKLLEEKGIKYAIFREPDLNWSLTSIALLLDERVFNRKEYPTFRDHLVAKYGQIGKIDWQTYEDAYPVDYDEWYARIGDEKQHFLREFVSQFRMA